MSNRSSRGLYPSWWSVFRRFCIYRRHGTQRRKSDSNERKKKKKKREREEIGAREDSRGGRGGDIVVRGWTIEGKT